jgi:hypothetical protein
MGDGQAAVGFDRLPWLADEPRLRPKRAAGAVVAWAAAAILLVAGGAYWAGVNSVNPLAGGSPPQARPSTTVPLPAPRAAAGAEAEIDADRSSEVEPIVAPPIPLVEERPSPPHRAPAKARPHRSVSPSVSARPAPPHAAAGETLTPWPARVIDGASGRLVRIGTFATAHQAKRGWWAVMRLYPGMKRLPALVVPVRSLRDGRVYYRLQMGTTSQAHSEVLCQRMRIIALSCVVIGLPDRSGTPAR